MKETTARVLVISVLLLALTAEVHAQKTADEWQSKAVELAVQGNIEAAKIAFDEAIKLSPYDAIKPHLAGVTMAAKGDHEAAVDYFDEAIKENPSDDLSLLLKGDSLQKLSKYDEAVKAYDRSIGIYSGNAVAWSHKGNALLAQTGKEAEALKAFDVSLRLNPNDDHVWLNKGDALAALGKYDEAINSYNQVIKINPNNADAYNNIGQAYFNQGNFEKALKWFDAAITKNPDYSAYVDWKCETLWKLSVNAGGGEWYEKYKTCRDRANNGGVPPVINTPPTKTPQNQPPCDPSKPFNDCSKISITHTVDTGP